MVSYPLFSGSTRGKKWNFEKRDEKNPNSFFSPRFLSFFVLNDEPAVGRQDLSGEKTAAV